MQKTVTVLGVVLFSVSQIFLQGCAHKKTVERVTLRNLQSKRVALAEVKGSKESIKHAEVAILNEILDRGRFQIVDRATVQEALVSYPTEQDWSGLGRKTGADYVLSINVKNFDIKERKGYDAVTEEDSVLTEESGSSKPVVGTRYVKVKSYEGLVKLACKLYDVAAGQMTYEGEGLATETKNSRDADFPRRMQLLESLSGKAINDFFEKIPK